MKLNSEQQAAYDDVKGGGNVFVTGPGGVGKSFLVKEIVKNISGFVITATTGVAAINVGGRTIHSFLMLGWGEKSKEELWEELSKKRFLLRNIVKAKKIIIDEISMADAEFFDKIEYILRNAKRSNHLFGNVQLVIVGDCLQIPYVQREGEEEKKFFFESESFKRGNFVVHELKRIQRQSDEEFITNLNKIRMGRADGDAKEFFESRVGKKPAKNISAINLHTHNYGVDRINFKKLNEIRSELKALDWVKYGSGAALKHLEKNCPAPENLELKVGAQVICLANLDLDAGIANGSVGVVTGFESQYPVVRFNGGEERTITRHAWESKETKDGKEIVAASVRQVPLKLGWAISVHKSMGQTLDHAIVNLSGAFEFGMVYTALSRVKNIEGLYIESVDWDKVAAHPEAVRFYDSLAGTL